MIEDKIRILDLNLWIIKYFIEASASNILPLIFIKGRKPIRLSSKPIHIDNQWEEDKESIEPINMIVTNKKFEGKNLLFIKGRTVWIAQNKVSSLISFIITFLFKNKDV